MSEKQLIEQARQAAKNAKHNLKWIRDHPERIMPGKKVAMVQHLEILISFSKEERKNARRAGRTRLRKRLSDLVVAILTQTGVPVKEAKRNA
ncbi:hypothetical protein [Paenibacillus koleovorans]|uniref:hypothetical protein n=1 Tax=Paenibacillus koleovorans TaxID=121608 RepID=UPI000FD920FB|nr:hypothetical protein [Paenibacillus koleovorans]